MNGDDPESLIHRRLSQLPPPRAPRTLVPRVMARVRKRRQSPWYAQPWIAWPRVWQVVSVTLLLGLCSMAWYVFEGARGLFDFYGATRVETSISRRHRHDCGAGGKWADLASCDSGTDCRTSHVRDRGRVHGERVARCGVGPFAPGKGGWTMKFAWAFSGLLVNGAGSLRGLWPPIRGGLTRTSGSRDSGSRQR